MAAENQTFELIEPASPEALVPTHSPWPWFAAAAVILLIAAVVWRARKRKPADPSTSIRQAAFTEASAALASASSTSTREAAVISSLILRKYLSTAAADPALFETHEEFISRRDSLLSLTPDARAAAASTFSHLASLKYAPEIAEDDPAVIITRSKSLLETLHHGFAA